MSRIPDCRTDEYYNEKYLTEKDKEFVDGYDWAVESAVDNYFDNNFLKGMDDDSYIGHLMTSEVPDSLKEKYEVDYKYGERKKEVRTIETVADYVRAELIDWIESCRDELITSMLDSMGEEEYKAQKAAVDGMKESE